MTSVPERLQLRITLDNIKPKIWRRVVVRNSLTFRQLHAVIQCAMGWEDCHLHEFRVGDLRIGTRGADDGFGFNERDIVPETSTRLYQVLAGKRSFRYWYDFGDDWWHEIVIEKRFPDDQDAPPAELLAGERACPPEDCGGPWGYVGILEALDDPRHPEHGNVVEWLGGTFDAETFDAGRAGERVRKAVRRPRTPAA